MFVNLNSGVGGSPGPPSSLFHGSSSASLAAAAAVAGCSRSLGPPDPISSLNQPYGSEIPHYGPIYYSNYASSLKSGRSAPYARPPDQYYNVYQNFYHRPATVPNSFDTRWTPGPFFLRSNPTHLQNVNNPNRIHSKPKEISFSFRLFRSRLSFAKMELLITGKRNLRNKSQQNYSWIKFKRFSASPFNSTLIFQFFQNKC